MQRSSGDAPSYRILQFVEGISCPWLLDIISFISSFDYIPFVFESVNYSLQFEKFSKRDRAYSALGSTARKMFDGLFHTADGNALHGGNTSKSRRSHIRYERFSYCSIAFFPIIPSQKMMINHNIITIETLSISFLREPYLLLLPHDEFVHWMSFTIMELVSLSI